MRKIWFALCLAFVCASAITSGQANRFGFAGRPRDGQTVSGTFIIRVSADPFVRPSSVRPAVVVDGKLLDYCDPLPWRRDWDTASGSNGEHVIRLVFVDSRTNLQTAVDEMRVRVNNRETVPPRDPGKPLIPLHDPTKSVPISATGSPAIRSIGAEQDATIHAEPKPFSIKVRTICLGHGSLYGGLDSGGLLVIDTETKSGATVLPPIPSGPVKAITTGGGAVWWLARGIDTIDAPENAGKPISASSQPVRWLFSYRPGERKVSVFDLRETAQLDQNQLSYWKGRIVLTGRTGGCVFDPTSGTSSELGTALPTDALSETATGRIFLCSNGNSAVLMTATRESESAAIGPSGWRLSLWRTRANDEWSSMGSCTIAGDWQPDVSPPVISADRVVIAGAAAVTEIRIKGDTPEVSEIPLPAGEALNGVRAVASDGADIWLLRSRVVFRLTGGKASDGFLGWNETGLDPQALAADLRGAWVATNAGIRRIMPDDAPDRRLGYGGFVHVRLEDEQAEPATTNASRLAAEIESWRGTPYKYGGESRQGVDCSGFVMLAFKGAGIDLPHGSDNLRSCSLGAVVHDELRYGDVLVYPGHCAIYTGNGFTAETANNQVGGRSIWFRTEVVVRRFLDAEPATSRGNLASRGGKPRNSKKHRS